MTDTEIINTRQRSRAQGKYNVNTNNFLTYTAEIDAFGEHYEITAGAHSPEQFLRGALQVRQFELTLIEGTRNVWDVAFKIKNDQNKNERITGRITRAHILPTRTDVKYQDVRGIKSLINRRQGVTPADD